MLQAERQRECACPRQLLFMVTVTVSTANGDWQSVNEY